MFTKDDKRFDKQLDKTLDGILEFYIPAIEKHNSFVEESNEKLYNYYSSSHIIRKSEYYSEIKNDITIKIIRKKGENIEFIQIGEYKPNADKEILEEIKKLEKSIAREQSNFEILDKRAKNFLDELADMEKKLIKSRKSRNQNLAYLLENGLLEPPRKKSLFLKIKNWFLKL